MYKNLEKVYVDSFSGIDRKSAVENKLYILKHPHWEIYNKWIYNRHYDRMEPLTPPIIWHKVKELLPYKHVPGKLDMKVKSKYLEVENINRTQADGLAEGLIDEHQQHFLIDATKLDSVIDNLTPETMHAPGRLDLNESSEYLTYQNINREDLYDVDEQHFMIDTTKLDDKINEIADGNHAPGQIDTLGSSKYLEVSNVNRNDIPDTHQQRFLVDTAKLDTKLDEIEQNQHAPSKLDKTDNEYDYVTVKNENRTDISDTDQQHHLVDTSKLDFFLNSLQINNGTEVEIAGASTPPDDSDITLGDINEFNDIKVYYSSTTMSITKNVNFLSPVVNGETSFIITNIGDEINPASQITGEIGQTLAKLNDDLDNAILHFYNSALFRFRSNIGQGANGSFNIFNEQGNNTQPGGSFMSGNVRLPYPSIGPGWLQIEKITGVTYGTSSLIKTLQNIIKRLDKEQYVIYNDYIRYLKYVISSKSEKQLALLNHLEKFEQELKQQPDSASQSYENYYAYLIAYRDKLRKGDDTNE